MWKGVLVSALALAATCDAFGFAPSAPLTTARRAGVLPQARSAAPALGLRSLRAVATKAPKPFEFPPVLGLGFKALGKHKVELIFKALTWGLDVVITDIDALARRRGDGSRRPTHGWY